MQRRRRVQLGMERGAVGRPSRLDSRLAVLVLTPIALGCWLDGRAARWGTAGAGGLRGAAGDEVSANPAAPRGFLARRREPERAGGAEPAQGNASEAEAAPNGSKAALPVAAEEPAEARSVFLNAHRELAIFGHKEKPWQATATILPNPESLEVMRWWNAGTDDDFSLAYRFCNDGDRPHIHLYVRGRHPLHFEDGGVADGLHTLIMLPPNVERGMTSMEWVHSDFPSFGDPLSLLRLTRLDPARALRIRLVLHPEGTWPRILFRVFWPLLMPQLFWGRAPLVAKVAVVSPFCFLLLQIAWMILLWGRRRFALGIRRRRRIARLQALRRAAEPMTQVFSQEDCCICLAGLGHEEDLIMLLPCKHVVHYDCYSSWVGAPSYVAMHLRCPMCNCPTAGVARPVDVNSAKDAGAPECNDVRHSGVVSADPTTTAHLSDFR